MNAFHDHHRDRIRFDRCFDRILLNGLLQPFQRPERVVGFFDAYRRLYPVSREVLRGIAEQFQQWVKGWSEKRNIPVVEAPKGRRDEFVDPYFKRAKPDRLQRQSLFPRLLRYDLAKHRAKGLVAKHPRSRRYFLLPQGYSVCLVFLKLFERSYAPLTAALLGPSSGDSRLHQQKQSQLDRLYQRVVDDLDHLVRAIGLKAA